ncbi:MAG: LysR family transcriptional regulator [Granulosicoccus sp.]
MEKWTELRTAYQVAKLGTVSAAAQTLGLHRATVNRHIDILEQHIGATIFIRHARGYTLTEVGQDVLRVAQKTEELINDLAGRIKGGRTQIEGQIKLTILAPFASLLMGAIADFRSNHPLCLVDIDTSEDLARLEYGEAHIALRAGAKPTHPDYIVSSFGDVSFNLYAHDSYIERHGTLKDSHSLKDHKFVLPQVPEGRLPFEAWVREHISPEMIALSSRNIWITTEAIMTGIGIGFMSDHEARQRGKLQAALPANADWSVHGWIVTHVDMHRTEKLQAMLSCIKASRRITRLAH